MNNIYKYGNIRECSKKQIFLIHILRFLDKNNIDKLSLQPVHIIQSHYLDAHLPAKTCEAPKCVCPFYTPAHQRNCLQLLTPTLNIANCHTYMSTVIPAEVQCYITQWYHYTREGLP